jgi:ParB-like chromosome segregation protein Spo0J
MSIESLLELCITYSPVDELKDYPRNARTHSKRQIHQIADSIKAFGFTNPVLLDSKNPTRSVSWAVRVFPLA